jgi:hypothetical protein
MWFASSPQFSDLGTASDTALTKDDIRLKAIFFANTEWYLFNFRLPWAKRLRSQGFEVLLISPPGEYGERLREAGFRWQALPMDRRSLNPLRELGLLRRLAQLYRCEQPAVVHHFTIKCVVYGL